MTPVVTTSPERIADRRVSWVIGGLLVFQSLLGFHAAWRLTVTHDEYWHLPVGLRTGQTGRFDFDSMNPPLTRLWCAAPLVAMGAEADAIDPARGPGAIGDAFREESGERYRLHYAVGRGMSVLLAVVTGLLLAAWSWELFGRAASCLTVLLWCTCPTILANASLVTPDIGVTFFFVATLYALWRYARRPTWRGAIITGTILGSAQTAKFTALLLVPLCVVLWFVARGTATDTPTATTPARGRWLLTRQWCVLFAATLFAWNAVYLYRGSVSTVGSYNFQCAALHDLKDEPRWLSQLPVPLPRDYVIGLDAQRRIMEQKHPVYLDGEWSTEGFRSYYLMTLWYKLPHVLQWLVLLAGLFVLFPRGEPRLWGTQAYLLSPVFALLAVASTGGMQLGIRYVLPVVPLLMLFAGQTARWIGTETQLNPITALRNVRTGLVLIPALLAPLSLRYHPHHLAYFNELAGGPVGGRWHLVDSNLDWGQALRDLSEELDRREIKDVNLLYFGTVPPPFAYRLPTASPQPGWYAVSVNFVQGRPHVIRDPQGGSRAVGLDEYGPFFRFFEPVAHVGYAIDLYHITEVDLLQWERARQRDAATH